MNEVCLGGYLSDLLYLCILDCKSALSASGSSISHAILMLHANYIMPLLQKILGRRLICQKSCTLRRSISSIFHSPAATLRVPIYIRMLLASECLLDAGICLMQFQHKVT